MDNRELREVLDALEWQLIVGLIAGWVMMIMKVFGVALLAAGIAGPHTDVGPLLTESIACGALMNRFSAAPYLCAHHPARHLGGGLLDRVERCGGSSPALQPWVARHRRWIVRRHLRARATSLSCATVRAARYLTCHCR